MAHSTRLSLLLASPAAQEILNPLTPQLEQLLSLIDTFRSQPITPQATHAFESQLQVLLRQLGLRICADTFNHLEPQNPQDMPARLQHQGQHYRRRQPTRNHLATAFGSFTLHRFLYEDREPGQPCLFPLEQQLGLVAGAATPALAERAAALLAQHTQKQTLAILKAEHDVSWSVDTLRKVTAAMADNLESQRLPAQTEQVLTWLQQAQNSHGRNKPVLVAGRDGIHLPEGDEGYHEGALATLSVQDRKGKRLGTVYVGGMPQPGQRTLSEQLTALIEEVLRQWRGPLPRLAYVTDNGHHPLEYFHQVLTRMRHPRSGKVLVWHRVSDYYHVSQYLSKMAEALFGATAQAKQWAGRMRRWLKEKGGLKRVLISATYHHQQQRLSRKRQEAYEQAYGYLRGHRQGMDYARYRQLGIPLGSGVTEAGCKIVFTQRLKRSGMRWQGEGGQVVVTLRVLLLSGVWQAAVALWLKHDCGLSTRVQPLNDPNNTKNVA
jgi:hypothetical protein